MRSCCSVQSEMLGTTARTVTHGVLCGHLRPSLAPGLNSWESQRPGLFAKGGGARPGLPRGPSLMPAHQTRPARLTGAALTLGHTVPAGARWDTQTGFIAEARLKELTPAMPVIFIRAIPVDRMDTKNIYECPVYKTRIRGPTYVWTFNLKTKEKAAKWILAAVALLLQV